LRRVLIADADGYADALRGRDPDRCRFVAPPAVSLGAAQRCGGFGDVAHDRGIAAGEFLQRGRGTAVVLREGRPEPAGFWGTRARKNVMPRR
jgi:hypothetical protein